MKNSRCIILGGGRMADQVARYLAEFKVECHVAAWKSVRAKYRGILTIDRGFRLGHLQDAIDTMTEHGVAELAFVGRIDPQVDFSNPDSQTTRQLIEQKSFSAIGYLKSALAQLGAAKISTIPLREIAPSFGVNNRFARPDQATTLLVDSLRETIDKQVGPSLINSAVFVDGQVIKGEGVGIDNILKRIAETYRADSGVRMLIKLPPAGIGDLAPAALGPDTLRLCHSAKIDTIVVAKRNTIISHITEFCDTAAEFNIRLIAI